MLTNSERTSTEAEAAANACLKWGVIGMFAWIIPVGGLAVPWIGLSRGKRGWHAANRDRARFGVILCIISMGMGGLVLCWVSYWILIFVSLADE